MPILVTKFIFSTHLLAAETKQNEEVIMIKTMNIRICILHFKDIVLRDPMEQEDSTLQCQINQIMDNNRVFLISKKLFYHRKEFTEHLLLNNTVSNKLKSLTLTIKFHLPVKILVSKINFNLKNLCQFLQGIQVI